MKKVLIVSRRQTRKDKLIDWVSEVYLQLLAERGVIPVIVPIAEATKNILDGYLADYDGVIMMEGGDVNPALYGADYPAKELEELDMIKDEIEIACCQHAIDNNKSVLGFCRGLQIVNILHGGSIVKDVHELYQQSIRHINYDNYDAHRHLIHIKKNTPLFDWYKAETLQVNSYHHQGIKELGEGLQSMATAEDGLVEAIYSPSKKFLVGLQFHPERMLSEHEGNYKVFDAFVESLK